MPELRWILLAIGIVVVAGVYAYTRYQRHVRNEAEFERPRRGRDLLDDESDTPTFSGEVPEVPGMPKIVLDDPGAEPQAAAPDDGLLVLHVRAPGGATWRGDDLLRAARAADLETTDKAVFQYFADAEDGERDALFHVANMTTPGTFDWRGMDQFKTRGLSLFTQAPTSASPAERFDLMLACAERLAEELGGEVLDRERGPLSAEAAAALRASLEA